MNNQIVRLQLPNGNLLKIEGATSDEAAAIIAERVAPAAPLPISNVEEAYGMPVLNFSKDVAPVHNADGEEALAMPSTH